MNMMKKIGATLSERKVKYNLERNKLNNNNLGNDYFRNTSNTFRQTTERYNIKDLKHDNLKPIEIKKNSKISDLRRSQKN